MTLETGAPIEVLEEVVVAARHPGRHLAWPAAALAGNGDLLIAYKEATDHQRTDDAVVWITRSNDGGISWYDDRPVAALPGWSFITNHALSRLSDGTLLLNLIKKQYHANEYGENAPFARSYFTRSTTDGRLWDSLGDALDIPEVKPDGSSAAYGSVSELPDGRLMVPFFGVPAGAARPRSAEMAAKRPKLTGMAFSSDQARTWSDYVIIHEDLRGDLAPSETDIVRLADGRFLAMIRATAVSRLYRSYSDDEGRTWSPIQPTQLPGHCPALLTLASGDLLCAYRDVRPEQPGMSCAVSEDQGETWQPVGYLYKGANRDCAYPSMVRLLDGRIFCAFYTAAIRESDRWNSEIHGLILEDRSVG